jgi:hypothetical protein
LKLHHPSEVETRAKQLQLELGRKVQGFEVFVEIPQMGITETRNWTYITKHNQLVTVLLTVKSLIDENNKIVGFMGIAKIVPEKSIH